MNLLLGTFNLLPFAPLDGSTVILLFMSEKTAQRYLDWLRGNSFAMAGLLVGMLVFRYIYGPIDSFVSALLLPRQRLMPRILNTPHKNDHTVLLVRLLRTDDSDLSHPSQPVAYDAERIGKTKSGLHQFRLA